MTREEMFKNAANKRKEEKEEEKQKGGGFEDIHYVALEEGVPKIIRFVGLPASMRGDDPFSPKLVNMSQILGDDAKKFRCVWPIKNERPDWILWKIYNKVMSGKWDNGSQSKVFDYREKFPSIWRRVAKNDNIENQYEKGWKPSALVVMNVIDRSAMQWHQENKHYAILSKKVSDNNGKPWYDPGVPQMLYNLLFDTIVPVYGDWETYDCVIIKMTADPWYQVWQADDDKKKINALYPNFSYDSDIAGRPLTEEEMSWEKYNIDKITPVTSYQKINNRLKIFIQQVDEAFKTHFYQELQELVEQEKKYAAEHPVEKEEEAEEEKPQPAKTSTPTPAPVKETPVETPAPERVSRKVTTPAVNYIDTLISKGHEGLKKCSDTEKALIIGYDEVKEKPIWKQGLQLFQCPRCKELGPEQVKVCIKCGIEFEE